VLFRSRGVTMQRGEIWVVAVSAATFALLMIFGAHGP